MARNAALDTKVKAMQATMLSDSDFKNLIEAKDLNELTRYLKENSHFAEYLKDIHPETAHRADIESALTRYKTDATEKLLHYLQGADRDFLMLFIMRSNLESFKVLIRGLAKGEDLKTLAKHLSYSNHFAKIPFDKLIEAKDWDSFKEALKGTPYYRTFEVYDKLNPDEDLYPIEKGLERQYYDVLYKRTKKLDKKACQSLIGTMRSGIDLLNLIWIYRGKKFYHYSPEQILPYTYQGGEKVKQEDLNKMAAITDMNELMEELKKYKQYDFLFEHDEKDRDLHMERRRERYMFYKYRKMLKSEEGLDRAYAYLKLLEYEMEDIVSIIEGKRYNLSEQEMKKYLIRSMD